MQSKLHRKLLLWRGHLEHPDQGCLVLLRIYFKFINDKYISAVSALSLFSLYYWESTSNFTMINISVTSRKDWLKCVRCGLNPSIFILTSQHFMETSTPIPYHISTNFISVYHRKFHVNFLPKAEALSLNRFK